MNLQLVLLIALHQHVLVLLMPLKLPSLQSPLFISAWNPIT